MKHPSRLIIVLLAAVSGLAATGILHRASASAASDKPREPMVVAAVSLAERQALAPDNLKVVLVHERPAGAFEGIEQLKGRLPLVAVPAGQPVLSSHLDAEGAEARLSNRVPPGQRAITVGINEIAGVAGFIKPDLHVDIIGVAQEGQVWHSTLVAQNILVLAVAQEDQPKRKEAAPKVATSATLLVTPEQAKAISLATERGRIRLVLRSQDDHVIVKNTPPAPPRPTLARQASAPARRAGAAAKPQPARTTPQAAPTAAPRAGIEVISGEEMEVVHP